MCLITLLLYYTLAFDKALARRAFLRLAAFLWITPFAAALSTAEVVALSVDLALDTSSLSSFENFFTAVFADDLTMRLHNSLCAVTLTRLIADLIFGNFFHLLR